MTIADAYRRLGAVLSELESQGIEVGSVTPDEAAGEEPLVVDLRITVPSDADAPEVRFGDSPSPELAGADGGSRTVTAGATPSPGGTDPGGADPESDSGAASAADVAAETADGECPCAESGCQAAFDSAAALTVHRLSRHDRPEEPLHQHDPALRAAYEAYDSFSSMTDALGVDVTAQTVRRNMMKAGIHNPERDDEAGGDDTAQEDGADGETAHEDGATSGDETAEEGPDTSDDGAADGVQDSNESAADEQPIADGSGTATADSGTAAAGSGAGASGDSTDGSPAPASTPADQAAERLPGDVTVDALREAVVEGGSLRAVARRLDRSSGEARALLDELGLLDQVHGRVATRPDREQRAAAFDDWVEACRSDDPSAEAGRPDG